jgi:Tol biopolymer transport system component
MERRPRRTPVNADARRLFLFLFLFSSACTTSPALVTHTPARAVIAPSPTFSVNVGPGRVSPSLTPPPLNSRTPDPTATPAPALRQLTHNGCCVQPTWSPDGSQIWYIDRPSAGQPSGLYGLDLNGGEPQLVTDRLGIFSPDAALMAYPQAGQTIIERRATGERWDVPAAGRAIQFSPDGTQIAWQVANDSANFDRRLVEIWAANVDGGNARVVTRLIGGSLVGWFPDGGRVLVSGREANDVDPFLASVNIGDGSFVGIVRGTNIRGGSISPGGGWVAYQVAFSGDLARDGLWVAKADGREARKLSIFGAYRWRAEGQLIVVPLEVGAASHRLAQVEAVSGEISPLTDPRSLAFRIAGGDWALSPDGRRIVFVNAADRNLWLLELP